MAGKLPLRIAILETDTPAPGVLARYGTYGDIFKDLLKRGADNLKHPGLSSTQGLDISAYDVVDKMEYPELENIDAVLITGSKYDSFADTPWTLKLVDFTRKLLTKQTRVRVIGVCYGHQIIARALDAPVGRSGHWELSVTPVSLSPVGTRLFNTPTGQLRIHQMHQDAAFTYPDGVEPLGSTGACATQGMYAAKRLLTVQGHPEFNGVIMDELLDMRRDKGLFSQEMYEDAKKRAGGDHDGVIVGAAFLRFLLE